MMNLKIYDAAIGGSSEVRSSHVNEKTVNLSVFLKGLDKNEYVVERYNLSQQPEAFAANKGVAETLKVKGTAALPLIFVDDELRCSGNYPTVDELGDLLKLGCLSIKFSDSDCCSGECCCRQDDLL